jgi:hypothetical protein
VKPARPGRVKPAAASTRLKGHGYESFYGNAKTLQGR